MRSRTLLRWLLLVQALAAGVLAVLLHGAGLRPAWLAVLVAASAVLLVRLLITANNFAMSARFASPTPDSFRLGPGARVRMLGEEYLATMLHSSWFMAIGRLPQRLHEDKGLPPVLLLHGYGCNAAYWTQFARRLDAAGISHAGLDLEPVLASIDAYVPLVARAIDALLAASGSAQVILVGHSMGGLVARAYLRQCGSARVAHVFTLGTPHHGTSLASLGPGENARQMRYCAAPDVGGKAAAAPVWLASLAASESAQTRALITSLFTHHDNIVAPQTSCFLPGANNIAFGGVGHVALGRNPRVLARLLEEIVNVRTR